ncbi:MAG: hypothetical protein ACXVKA_16255 [Acidimicrobiia bacterium]
MFRMGPSVLLLGFFVIPLILAIIVVADAARRPQPVWTAAGQNQTLWIILPLVLLFACGIGSVIASVIYLAVIRPQLVNAERQAP